jgi:hypothetical protein
MQLLRYVTKNVVCPFHYTEGRKPSTPVGTPIFSLRGLEMSYYPLLWNGQVVSYSHRRDVAHGQGGNQGKPLVL